MENQLGVAKVTLSSGKVVLIREQQIGDQEMAAKAAAPRAGDNAMILAVFANQELVKLLLVEIDGKKPSASEKENLNNLLTIQDYKQIQRVIQKMAGDDEGNEPQIEFQSASGGK
jgi:hypothetical protein